MHSSDIRVTGRCSFDFVEVRREEGERVVWRVSRKGRKKVAQDAKDERLFCRTQVAPRFVQGTLATVAAAQGS
jgi:hypothetical protein